MARLMHDEYQHEIVALTHEEYETLLKRGEEVEMSFRLSHKKVVENLERIVKNIEIHFEHLCTYDLREHGFISENHDIDFQVFRALCGYKEALDELATLKGK